MAVNHQALERNQPEPYTHFTCGSTIISVVDSLSDKQKVDCSIQSLCIKGTSVGLKPDSLPLDPLNIGIFLRHLSG